jgi:Glyoxalase/Bleomycin resistance protein/Dioxygenase superfamily
MSLPHPGFSDAYQIAYVTRDLTRGIYMLKSRFGVDDFLTTTLDLDLNKPAAAASIKVGVAWVGDFQIELIEPVSGAAEIYSGALPRDAAAVALHHLAMRVSGDLQCWIDARAGIADDRIVIEGGRDGMRFAYVDERATLGYFLEYVWMSENFLAVNPFWTLPSRRHAAPPRSLSATAVKE